MSQRYIILASQQSEKSDPREVTVIVRGMINFEVCRTVTGALCVKCSMFCAELLGYNKLLAGHQTTTL